MISLLDNTQESAVNANMDASDGTCQCSGGVDSHGCTVTIFPSCSMLAPHSIIKSMVSWACLLLTDSELISMVNGSFIPSVASNKLEKGWEDLEVLTVVSYFFHGPWSKTGRRSCSVPYEHFTPRELSEFRMSWWSLFRKLESPSIMIRCSVLDANPIKKRKAVPEFPACKTLGGRTKPVRPGPWMLNLSSFRVNLTPSCSRQRDILSGSSPKAVIPVNVCLFLLKAQRCIIRIKWLFEGGSFHSLSENVVFSFTSRASIWLGRCPFPR